jgi:hypothetical protein
MRKSLDTKLANLRADSGAGDFILADAKDADMGFGIAATGRDPITSQPRSINDYRDQMRQIVRQGLVDIMLMSCSTSEVLTINERLFDKSPVTPAVRANDTFDIQLPHSGAYASQPCPQFATTTIDQIQSGKIDPANRERKRGANLGLFSITPTNDAARDAAQLRAYKDFRIEAERKDFAHFLEVFNPNAPVNPIGDLPQFMNDFIVRALAGVPSKARPIFLKIAYHSPASLEALVHYDSSIIVGILGGSSGTTFDAFHLLEQTKKHGARAALFGRKINHSEHQLSFVEQLHAIANGKASAEEAVRAYHGQLQKLKIRPHRSLADDLQSTAPNQPTSTSSTRKRLTRKRRRAG